MNYINGEESVFGLKMAGGAFLRYRKMKRRFLVWWKRIHVEICPPLVSLKQE